VFAFYQSALAATGYALIQDPRTENRFHVEELGRPMPVPPREFRDPEKLPAGEELCTLTLRIEHLSPKSALSLVQSRLNPKLWHMNVATADTVSLVDFAPSLRQVSRLLADADRAAGVAMTPIDLEFWIVDAGDGLALPPELHALKPRVDPAKHRLVGRAAARCAPPSATAPAQVTQSIGSRFEIRLRTQRDHKDIRLDSVRLTLKQEGKEPEVWYEANYVPLKNGELTILTEWGNHVLVVRATVK
jgi:hypothetical protein